MAPNFGLKVNLYYQQTDCVVLDKRLEEQQGNDGPTCRPMIHIAYTVDGRWPLPSTVDAM